MPDFQDRSTHTPDQAALPAIDPLCMEIRQKNFPADISFHTPGLKVFKTSEIPHQNPREFISISLTGSDCALKCDHCQALMLKGMIDLGRSGGSLFDLCAQLSASGTRGILVSGGSDRHGQVPLGKFIPDLVRARRELGLSINVHPGLPDEETCAALAEIGLDGVMVDIIGHPDTIREVYHLPATPQDYEAVLERLGRFGLPAVPHIILGLHYGKVLGEWQALEMISHYPRKVLVVVVLSPLRETPMQVIKPPTLNEIGAFFETARKKLPTTPILLGCARPLGGLKIAIDQMAIDAGFNGLAFPADGIVCYARQRGLQPGFINACCGVTWH